MRRLTALMAVLAAALLGSAVAQPGLVVDGREVPGVTTALVAGTAYAPAGELAAAVGADLYVDPANARLTFTLAGRILVLPVADSESGSSATLDGAPVAAGRAVRDGVEIFVPVKGVVEAFGGSVAYVADQNRVVAVMPRATVTDARLSTSAGVDRLRVRLSAPVPYSSYHNEAQSSLQYRFARSDLVAARSIEGDGILRADLIPGPGYVDLRLQLAPGVRFATAPLPSQGGFELIVEVSRSDAEPVEERRPFVVIDAGHGGDDPGIRFDGGDTEADLTLAFAQRLGERIGRSADVALTRRGADPVSVSSRAAAGVGADLFVSVHAAPLPPGQFRAYYLGEAGTPDELAYAIRENAADAAREAPTDSVRRQILLDLVPDLGTGERFAQALGSELFQVGGYRLAESGPAPLAVLVGAAGRGLLLEFSPADLASPSLPDALAAALTSVLGSGGF